MPDFFALLVLGHLTGDYLLQNKWMALNKSGNSFKCAIHCLLYSLSVGAITYPCLHLPAWWGLVFLSHFGIDRFSLADKWLDFIHGRSLRDFMANGKDGIPPEYDSDNYHCLRGGFTALVYAAADNTLHLLLMYYGGLLLKVC